jgi:tyrosyl-tRNA synthetase
LAKLLEGGKKLRLYQGFDPTGARLHLGHTVGLRKLMDFAQAGHEVIFLFGTGTVLVGDPSERETGRKLITQQEIDQNIETWKDQVKPIVDFNKVTIKQNGDWLTKLTLKEIIRIASNISAVQLFKRESFTRRIKAGQTVWYHETMYPLLQGYDSVVMDVDLEIGGTDQEFNMLIGRELQRKMNHREKFVLTTPMILGTDSQQMSKTSGNCVWLDDSANEMFGKLMSLPDEQIVPYLELVTDMPLEQVGEIKEGLTSGKLHPMVAKKELAQAVVTQFHGQKAAADALTHFETTIQGKQAATDTPVVTVPFSQATILEICKAAEVGESVSQIKRTIEQGGVKWNDQKITDPRQELTIHDGDTLKYGKRTFRKVQIKPE